MSDIENPNENHDTQISRREVFGLSSAALAAATLALAGAKRAIRADAGRSQPHCAQRNRSRPAEPASGGGEPRFRMVSTHR